MVALSSITQRLRVRLSTFMLLIVIVALTAALVDERRLWVADLADRDAKVRRYRAGLPTRLADVSSRLAVAQAIRFVESQGDKVDQSAVPHVRDTGVEWIVRVKIREWSHDLGFEPLRNQVERIVQVNRDWRAKEIFEFGM